MRMDKPHALVAHIGLSAAIAAFVVGICSGAILALVYEPSSQRSTVRLYHAESEIRDTSGDVLLRSGEVAAVEQIPAHRGTLDILSDSTDAALSVAARSHGLLVSSVAGSMVLRVHSLASSALVLALGIVWATMVLGGRSLRGHEVVIGMNALTMVLAWVGTTLSGTPKALDAYHIGRTLIVDCLPVVGDIAAAILPAHWTASRQFALHALWLVPLLGVLGGVVACHWRWTVSRIAVGVAGIVLVAGGVFWGLFDPPLSGGEQSKPVWYLGAPFALFHVLPADATMLMIVIWWAAIFGASRSRSAVFRKTAIGMLGIWLGAGALVSWLLGDR